MFEGETATLGQMLASIRRPPPKPDRADDAQYSVSCLPMVLGTYIYTTGGADVPRLIAKLDARYPSPAEALQEGRPQLQE